MDGQPTDRDPMLVGIYMPSGCHQRKGPVAVDRLESIFLRNAIQGILATGHKMDTEFIWFTEGEEDIGDDRIPVVSIRAQSSFLSLGRGSVPTIEEALKRYDVDVVLTRLDVPAPSRHIPRVLFTLDMHFCGDTLRNLDIPPPPLPKKVKQLCTSANAIICPSEYVHKACASRLEMGLEKAAVARAGVSDLFELPQDNIIDGPFALFILNRYTEPSIPTLLDAIKRNPDLFPPNLVVLGEQHPDEPEDWGIPIVRIERCPDTMTAALMQHAVMCLYLSKSEGSGIVILQAMKAGALLVTTKSGATVEIAGKVPFYCDADNPYSLLQSIRRMLEESPNEREKRQLMARTLIMNNTWEKCGAKLLSVIRRSLA